MPTSRLGITARVAALAMLFALGVPCDSVSAADHVVADPAAAPPIDRLQLTREIRARVDQMRRMSATFRLQYQRVVESPQLLLRARLDPALVQRSYRARTQMVRYTSGLIVATIDIGPGAHQAEWIAHEFEHVLEQLDGVDLPALAGHAAPGVWFSAGNMIETNRAVRAGRAVLDEMRRRDSRSDNLVQ